MLSKTDEWFSSLHVEEKERIASKVAGHPVVYPDCTTLWLTLDEKKKEWIQAHCTHKHDVVIPDWQEGMMYSE